MHEIADFLRGFPPFDDAEDSALDAVVAATEIEFFPEGALILRQGGDNTGHVHVIRTGWVELIADGRVFDVVGPGEVVGLPSLVSGLPTGTDARAAEDVLAYRVSESAIIPLLTGRTGLRFLARTLRARTPRRADVLADSVSEPIAELVRPAVVVEGSASIAHAVQLMHEANASSALIRGDGGSLGIVTDHDLRNRVLAAGVPTTEPVGSVATTPTLTARPDRSIDDAVLMLLAHGIRHLPVVDKDGIVLGTVEDVDLLAAQSRTPVRVRRLIARSTDVTELVAASKAVVPAVLGAYTAGHPVAAVTTTLSTLIEAVVAKAVEIHLRERGIPPVPFAWAVTGSVARREALPASDVDTLLAWDGDDADVPTRRWMRAHAADVLRTLAACGLRIDDNGVRADDPRFSRSVDAWRATIAGWAADPTSDQADIYLATLIDARPVWSQAHWSGVTSAVHTALARAGVRRMLHRVATAHRPPTGFVRDLVIESGGEHAGTVDLKGGGLRPAGAIGRFLASLTPGQPVTTAERVSAAALHGLVAEDDARDLVDAFTVVQSLRLDRHIAYANGLADDPDRVRPDDLTTMQRRSLRDAFRVIAHAQRTLPPPVARP